MKFISWNVNGIRACAGKGFMDFFQETDADIFCIQETKMQEGQLELDTGIMRRKKVIRGQQYLPSRNQSA